MFWGRRTYQLSSRKKVMMYKYQQQQDVSLQDIVSVAAIKEQCVLDMGCGHGESSLACSNLYPQAHIFACDLFIAGLAELFAVMETEKKENITLVPYDGLDVVHALPAASIDLMLLFFPDPWPKNRHKKRRLLAQKYFVDRVQHILKADGVFVWRTDSEGYWQHGEEILGASELRKVPAPEINWETTYEKKARIAGKKIYTQAYKKSAL